MPEPGERDFALISPRQTPPARWRDEYHATPVGAPLGALICLVIAAAPSWIFYHILTTPVWVASWGWFLLGPMLIGTTIVPLLIARYLWETTRSMLRSSNWSVRIREDALYVNLRSWLNWRLGDDDLTVVRLPWTELAAVHEVREEWRVSPRAGVRRVFKAHVAVRLRSDAFVAPIRDAARREVHRVITHPGFVRGIAAWSDVPAFVAEDETLRIPRVEMSLLRALARRVARTDQVVTRRWVGPEFPNQRHAIAPDDIAALVWRGEWTLAQMTAQFRLGLSYDESVRFVRELFAERTLD